MSPEDTGLARSCQQENADPNGQCDVARGSPLNGHPTKLSTG